MEKQFSHWFYPPSALAPPNGLLDISTTEISDAAIQEITQLSLPAAPFNVFLEQLLVDTDSEFCWVSALGHVRETKTALSGLFGRFVARAYLTRYFGYTYFEPIHTTLDPLRGWPHFEVREAAPGDRPDWIVASSAGANDIAIAEAKGSHDRSGPQNALSRARTQVQRVDIYSGTTRLRVKRYAVAIRWAIDGDQQLRTPFLHVHDPEDGDREPTEIEQFSLKRSIALGHFSRLTRGLGAAKISRILQQAKLSKPEMVAFPSDEVFEIVDSRGRQFQGVVGAVTPFGVVSLTARDENFSTDGLREAYGERQMVYAIDLNLLQKVCQGEQYPAKQLSGRERDDTKDLWKISRDLGDGSLLINISEASIRRIGSGSLIE